jgi:hypothetical protein
VRRGDLRLLAGGTHARGSVDDSILPSASRGSAGADESSIVVREGGMRGGAGLELALSGGALADEAVAARAAAAAALVHRRPSRRLNAAATRLSTAEIRVHLAHAPASAPGDASEGARAGAAAPPPAPSGSVGAGAAPLGEGDAGASGTAG